jgi:hypothetical protein
MSPQLEARLAGAIALITTTSGFTAIAVGGLVNYSDADATARNILGHEMLFRLAVAGSVVSLLYIAYTLLLYNLFMPVSSSLSWLAAWFSLVGCAVGAVNSLLLLSPLIVLGNARFASVFGALQSHSLALLFLDLYAQGSNISMVLFGAYNLLIGYLIFRSIFLPRVLGALTRDRTHPPGRRVGGVSIQGACRGLHYRQEIGNAVQSPDRIGYGCQQQLRVNWNRQDGHDGPGVGIPLTGSPLRLRAE